MTATKRSQAGVDVGVRVDNRRLYDGVSLPRPPADQAAVRRSNLGLVLRHLRDAGPRSRARIAQDTGLPESPPSPTEFTLGHNVSSRAEVDTVVEQARSAGATVVKEPHDTFWGGYSGYVQDPDGHLWEIVWNPELELDA